MALFRKSPLALLSSRHAFLTSSNPPPRAADTASLLGAVVVALESAYLLTSYMPLEENQFVAASVPVRLVVAALLASVCGLHGRRGMSASGFWEFVVIAAVDAVSAVLLGLRLGRFDGMVSAASRTG